MVVYLLPQIKAHISSYGRENSPASKPTAANHGSAGSAANATSASAPARRSIFEVKQGITWIHSLPDSALNVKLGCRLPPPATLATCPATPPKSESSQLLGDALARLQAARWRHHGRIHRHHAHQHESPKCQKSITITDLDSIARHPAGENIQVPLDFPKQHTTAIASEPSAIETGGPLALEMGAKSISDCVQCVFMGFCLRGGVTYCSYIQFTANQSPYVIFGGLYGLGLVFNELSEEHLHAYWSGYELVIVKSCRHQGR